MKTVTSVNRCLALRRRIRDYDNQIKISYEQRRIIKEQRIFEKAKVNKNVLYKYIKKCNRTK